MAIFPYRVIQVSPGVQILRPQVTLELSNMSRKIEVDALPDSGATVNVLPFSFGIELGLNWDEQRTPVQLTGNLAKYEAKGIIVKAIVAGFSVVSLAFAWTHTDNVPVLLGQVNFFAEFDVSFSYSRRIVEVKVKP